MTFRIPVCCLVLLAALSCDGAQPRFFVSPYRVFEVDSVLFQYSPKDDAIPLVDIAEWSWDFDGDGSFDLVSEPSPEGRVTWRAAYDFSSGNGGPQRISPRLKVKTLVGAEFTVNEITEPIYSTTPGEGYFLWVYPRSGISTDLEVSFSATPRLATNLTEVRFYSQVEPLQPLLVQGIDWSFGDGNQLQNTSTPRHAYLSAGSYDVEMRVRYELRSTPGVERMVAVTNLDFVRIVPSAGSLSLGRAYRRGFPSELDWDDIIKAYSALGAGGDRYVYFHHLENAFNEFLNKARGFSVAQAGEDPIQLLAETVNELLQGQSLVANQRLIEALRIRYPRIGDYDPNNPPPRLPAPPGAREETAQIDVALLDYQAALHYAFGVIQEFGPGILRSRAEAGREPYADFPAYITFLDPTLSQQTIPIKNEFWQLTAVLDRLALGTVEKAKRLFRLSIQDPIAREEAREECKKAGLRGYLGMALLAAAQKPEDFAFNEGNSLLAHVANARDLFEQINAGLNPLGNDGSFIPNESFVSIYQDALEAVADARESEINFRQEDRTYDRYQADLRNEQQAQRQSFITPLKNLTGLDPALYNNLATVNDQIDFRNTIRSRVDSLVQNYPNADPSGLGEFGLQVISVFDAFEGIRQADNRLKNLYETIRISEWANAEIDLVAGQASSRFKALDIARGYANSVTITFSGSIGTTISRIFSSKGAPETVTTVSASLSSTVQFTPTAIALGYLNATERDIQLLQSAQIADVQLEEQARRLLLEVANLVIDIRRAKNRLDQERLRLETMITQMDRLIEDLAHMRETAADLYFQDPSFRIVVSQAQRRASAELEFAIDRLYRLAKTLQYEWTEPYQNPVIVPVSSAEPPALENILFDKFSSLDSLFLVRTADEAKDYLDALKAWDSKLRRINLTSVRGPNHAGPISAEPISLREQIFNLRPRTNYNEFSQPISSLSVDESVQQFRGVLAASRVENPLNVDNPSLLLEFATGIADNSLFPATGSRWNMRIASLSVDLIAESGFSTRQVAEVDLLESGMVTLRRFFADPPFADDLFNLTFHSGRSERSAFGIVIPARINGASGGRSAAQFESFGLAGRPVAATRWILKIDTSNPSNRDLKFDRLKDIVLRITYTYGNPAEFINF